MATVTISGGRRYAAAVTVLAGALLSAGCLRLDMTLTVSPQNTITGEVVMAYDADLLDHPALAGTEPPVTDDLFPDVDSGQLRSEPFREAGFVGTRYRFDGVPLDTFDIQDSGSSFRLTREEDHFVLQAFFDFRPPEDLQGVPMGLIDATMEFQIALTFPGPVRFTNGRAAGRTVVWDLRVGEQNGLVAVASARPDRLGVPAWAWPPVGVAAVLAFGLVGFGVRGLRPAPAAPPPVGFPATPWPDPYQHPEHYDWYVETPRRP